MTERAPWTAVTDEVADVLGRVAPAQFDALTEILRPGDRRWLCSGQGRSGLLAAMVAMRLMHLGRTVHLVGEATAPAIRAGDGLLLVSASGRTPTTLAFADTAQHEGAVLAVVTADAASPLAARADVLLEIPVRTTVQFGGSLFEQTALLLLDAVVLELSGDQPEGQAGMHRRHTNLQ